MQPMPTGWRDSRLIASKISGKDRKAAPEWPGTSISGTIVTPREQVLQVHLYGSLQKDVLGQIDASECRRMFILHGLVPRDRAASEMLRGDLLLLIQGADDVSSETIPSKVYEYFQARRPVLGLVYKNPELWGMLERLGHRPAGADDPKGIKEAVLHFVRRWEENGLSKAAEPSPITVEAAVEQLVGLTAPCVRRAKG